MKLNDFNFDALDFDKWPRVLWGKGNVWKTSQDGIPHRLTAGYNGELLSVFIPEGIPMKYKNRKATSAIIYCNSCELVTGIEIHYGNPSCFDGHALQINPETLDHKDVTSFYRCS